MCLCLADMMFQIIQGLYSGTDNLIQFGRVIQSAEIVAVNVLGGECFCFHLIVTAVTVQKGSM